MKSESARPVGLQMQAALAPSMSARENTLLDKAAALPERLNISPMEILNDSREYAKLVALINNNESRAAQPEIENLRDKMEQDIIKEYYAAGDDTEVNKQIGDEATRRGLEQVFSSGVGPNSSIGKATLQSAIGKGVLGAREYKQNQLDRARGNAAALVSANPSDVFAPGADELVNFELDKRASAVDSRNQAVQGLLSRGFQSHSNFGNTVNNAANQLQSVENANVQSRNASKGALMGGITGLAGAGLTAF